MIFYWLFPHQTWFQNLSVRALCLSDLRQRHEVMGYVTVIPVSRLVRDAKGLGPFDVSLSLPVLCGLGMRAQTRSAIVQLSMCVCE